MIDILQAEIRDKIGFKIKTRGDCELLSNIISETLDKDISYNTLRRFFGITNKVNPNVKTLNILSEYLGYKNYIDFTQNFLNKETSDIANIVFKTVNGSCEFETINLVQSVYKSSKDFVNFITLLTRELLHFKKYTLINKLFSLPELAFENFTYSEVLSIGNSVGLLLRAQNNDNENVLLRNSNFLKCVYLTFVDYSSLNGYYGNWTKIIYNNKLNKENELFTGSVLQLMNLLNNKPVFNIFEDQAFNSQNHPILCGRLLSIKILANDFENLEATLDLYYKDKPKKDMLFFDYFYELMIVSILTKNVKLMQYIIINQKHTKPNFYYQTYHLNIFYLMSCFYYKLVDDSSMQKTFEGLFDPKDIRHSYEEFVVLFYKIYLNSKTVNINKKGIIKKEYDRICDKLKYPYFSDEYFYDYF
jgi:hypothetical protein